MDDGEARFWDSAFKIVSAIGLIAAGCWTVSQYFQSRAREHEAYKHQVESAAVEAAKPFNSKQLEVYVELTEAAARLAEVGLPKTDQITNRRHFDLLVNGPFKLVAGEAVNKAVSEFYLCLNENKCPDGRLDHYSRNIARSCRESVAKSWNITLEPLSPTTNQRPAGL
jgi:hypothetical protein